MTTISPEGPFTIDSSFDGPCIQAFQSGNILISDLGAGDVGFYEREDTIRSMLAVPVESDDDILHALTERSTIKQNMVTLPEITVRLSVSSYLYRKLKEILLRFLPHEAILETKKSIIDFMEEGLNIGRRAREGNVVAAWNRERRDFDLFASE